MKLSRSARDSRLNITLSKRGSDWRLSIKLSKRDLGLRLKRRLKESESRKRDLDRRPRQPKLSVLDSNKNITQLSKNA